MTNNNVKNPQIEETKNHSDDSASKAKTTKSKNKTKIKIQPVYAVLTKARRQFERQVKQDTANKRACIEYNIGRHYQDSGKFWMDFVSESRILLDSIRFNDACKSISLEPK